MGGGAAMKAIIIIISILAYVVFGIATSVVFCIITANEDDWEIIGLSAIFWFLIWIFGLFYLIFVYTPQKLIEFLTDK